MELNGMNIIALLIIVVLIISISLAIISLIGLDLQRTVPKQIQETYTKLVLSLFQKSPYNVCEALSGKQISYQEFQNLLLAAYNAQCGDTHASVTLSRSYSKEDIEQVAKINAIADDGKLIYYREAVPFGVGGLIIQGNPGYFPLKKWDTIDVWSVGKPTADTMINVTEQGCDPYDEICQASCTYKKICDPVCDDGKQHDITCNIACIDTAGDGVDIKDMEARVAANKCNPDCYANRTNPFKAYDPGCVWKFKEQRDDICDPNSNGVIDGVCDPDCINTKNICDFDCNGTVYSGNPMGLKDEKCLVCDGECNGWCSPACNKNAVEGMPGYDPDCRKEVVHNFWCSGDGLCENDKGENCENSADCKQICDDQNLACCPKFSDSDYAGCTASKDLKEGSVCGCSNQCGQLKCDETGHCCPKDKVWDGTKCVEICDAGPYDRFTCMIPAGTGYNYGLDVCKTTVKQKINEWILNNPDLEKQKQNGKYDNIVREIWKRTGPWGNKYCDPACTGSSKTVSGLIDGSISCGVCNHWAAVGTSLIRTAGIPKDRVYSLAMIVYGGGHAVTLYKSDEGEIWILDYTCCGRLFKASDWGSCGGCACASLEGCAMDNDYYSGQCTNIIGGFC